MGLHIEPLGAKVVANGNGNKTNLSSSRAVYICATAADLITNVTKSATFQVPAGAAMVMFKDKADEIHSGATTTHFTPIAYPRG